ncbi:MAG: zinc ribbon domain-containing protein [Faecalibacterium sp.]|nr:zinc ribbon domain-containing protein [Ruminococcus sp.]MCM1391525.1 zinc ribbon domain-containing protein [Ruminococcus sp.]MCM1485513.1 zinc ribbon domain-containing protein [Faecalibacterium sp.]
MSKGKETLNLPKFCGNCGAQLPNDANVCGMCGTKCENIENTTVITKKRIPLKISRKMLKRIISIVVVISVLIGLTTLAVKIISPHVGYMGTVTRTMNAFKNYDIDTIMKETSDICYFGCNEEEVKVFFTDKIDYVLYFYDMEYGEVQSINYKVNSIKSMSKSRIKKVKDELSEGGYNTDSIKGIKEVSLYITVKGEAKTETKYNGDLYLVKENGKWKSVCLEDYTDCLDTKHIWDMNIAQGSPFYGSYSVN